MSLLHDVRDGPPAEMAVVGYEGVVGITLLMGGETTPGRAVVQSAGYSFRLNAALLKKDFDRAGPLQQLLLRYAQALISQMAQTAMCNLRHATKQQL